MIYLFFNCLIWRTNRTPCYTPNSIQLLRTNDIDKMQFFKSHKFHFLCRIASKDKLSDCVFSSLSNSLVRIHDPLVSSSAVEDFCDFLRIFCLAFLWAINGHSCFITHHGNHVVKNDVSRFEWIFRSFACELWIPWDKLYTATRSMSKTCIKILAQFFHQNAICRVLC